MADWWQMCRTVP